MESSQKERGFSLIELLTVVAIIGIAVGAAVVKYKRDKSKDHLIAAAGQVTSILRGASAAGLAVGRNAVVRVDVTAADDILIWIDDDYEQDQDAAELVIGKYSIPATWTDVKFEYVYPAPARLEFLHRGDSRINSTGPTSTTAPSYSNVIFLRMSTGPTTPATSDNSRWYTFIVHQRTSFVQVEHKWCNAVPCT